MKVIDLLNKIANGEEIPKKIKYNGTIYEKYDSNNKYYDVENNTREKDILSEHLANESFYNDEVEILEEKKIPEKLDHLIGYDIQQFDDLKEYVEITTNDLFGKMNKVIDTLNQLSDYIKSKGE